MIHRNRHRRRVVPQIVRLIWRGVQAIAKALIYLTVEFTVYVAIGGGAIALFWLGLPSYVALGLSIGFVILSLNGFNLLSRSVRPDSSRTKDKGQKKESHRSNSLDYQGASTKHNYSHWG